MEIEALLLPPPVFVESVKNVTAHCILIGACVNAPPQPLHHRATRPPNHRWQAKCYALPAFAAGKILSLLSPYFFAFDVCIFSALTHGFFLPFVAGV